MVEVAPKAGTCYVVIWLKVDAEAENMVTVGLARCSSHMGKALEGPVLE